MTALKRETIELAEQMSEESITAKMKAFQQLEKMIIPVPTLDYNQELAEERDERYGNRKRF